jgi:hypothetical protein
MRPRLVDKTTCFGLYITPLLTVSLLMLLDVSQAGGRPVRGVPGGGGPHQHPQEVPGLSVLHLSDEQIRLAEAVLGGGQEEYRSHRPCPPS